MYVYNKLYAINTYTYTIFIFTILSRTFFSSQYLAVGNSELWWTKYKSRKCQNQLRRRKVQFYTLNCLVLILVPCCFLLALGLLKLVLLASGNAWDFLERKTLMLECYDATRMKISRAFLGSVWHVCYHSNIFHEYSPGPQQHRPIQVNRPLQQPVPVALHPLASRSAEPVS